MAQSRKLYWCSVCFAMDTAKFLADVAPKKTSPGFQNVSSWVTNLNKLKLVVLLMLILNLRIFCGTICLYLSVVAWKTHFFSWGKTPWTSATPKHAEKRSNRVKKHRLFFIWRPGSVMCGDTSRSNIPPSSQSVAKHLTARVNDPRTTSLITVASPETNPSPDYNPNLLQRRRPLPERLTNRRTCHIYESEGSQSLYILHTLTPVALSFVRARQSFTKKAKTQGGEWKPPPGRVEWQNEGVTLHKHTQSYMSQAA